MISETRVTQQNTLTLNDIFASAKKFFDAMPPHMKSSLSAKELERLSGVFDFVAKNPESLVSRSKDLSDAIARFNNIHLSVAQQFPDNRINAIELSKQLGKDKKLPELLDSSVPANPEGFFAMFTKGIARKHYTFVETMEETSKTSAYLTTCLLVDAYAYSRKWRMDDLSNEVTGDLIVNTICELVAPGVLMEDMKAADWYNASYGYDAGFLKEAGISA